MTYTTVLGIVAILYIYTNVGTFITQLPDHLPIAFYVAGIKYLA